MLLGVSSERSRGPLGGSFEASSWGLGGSRDLLGVPWGGELEMSARVHLLKPLLGSFWGPLGSALAVF